MDRRVVARILPAIAALADDPRPPGVKRLKGASDLWRIRIGDYRVVYTIEDDRLVVQSRAEDRYTGISDQKVDRRRVSSGL